MSNSSSTSLTTEANTGKQSTLSRKTKPSVRDFVILCPSTSEGNGLAEALSAMYYLPHNYKLTIMDDSGATEQAVLSGHEAIKERINVQTNTGATLFSDINAIICGESAPRNLVHTPHVVVSKTASDELAREADTFTVSANSPEAVASAFLHIAKTAVA